MKKIILSAVVLVATMAVMPAAVFAETGDEILAKVENTLTGPKDYEASASMLLANMDGTGREVRELHLWFAGKNKSLIKFVSPAGIEGIGLLAEGDGIMSLYLPAQNRIRAIEGSLKNEDFQGTDFSYNEMGTYEYREHYVSVIDKEDASSWTLVLTRKPGSDRVYSKLFMTVDKTTLVPSKVELYSGDVLKKVLTIYETKKSGSYTIPVKIRIENVVRKHYTELTLADVKFDQGLEAQGIFTRRFLKKAIQ
ncbi:MAG: outer membrane lipoprotein-sorting protein [Spirochaetaceae bacterium]|nr:MAG: outer membrane lipoprotein-sorting protein [Spirochaetaceae bacterium]